MPALLGAVAVFRWIAGLKVHHDHAALTTCHPFSSSACQALNTSFNSTDWTMGNTIDILLQLAPALIGAFAGAPVLARELETGTFRFAWTQGFGRERWTIAKLMLLAAAITAAAGAFGQVFTRFNVNDPWVLSTWWTAPGGKPANQSVVNHVLGLFPTNGAPMVTETPAQAFAQHGITQWWRYFPVSPFWPMQFVKAGWLLALSVLFVTATVWLVRRRAA